MKSVTPLLAGWDIADRGDGTIQVTEHTFEPTTQFTEKMRKDPGILCTDWAMLDQIKLAAKEYGFDFVSIRRKNSEWYSYGVKARKPDHLHVREISVEPSPQDCYETERVSAAVRDDLRKIRET